MARDEPLLFQSLPRQRLLVALARYGPMRLIDAVEFSGGRFLRSNMAMNFHALGLTVTHGLRGHRMTITLNTGYPAFKQLKAMLLAIDANIPEQDEPLRPFIAGRGPRQEVEEEQLHNVFGSRFKTAIIMSAFLYGGSVERDVLTRILNRINCKYPKTGVMLNALIKQRIIETDGDATRIASNLTGRAEIAAFVRAFVKAQPSFDYRKLAKIPSRAVPVAKAYDWKKQQLGHDLPTGVAAASDGSPLLFGTNARMRALISLAVNGPMRAADLKRATRVALDAIYDLVKDGTLVNLRLDGRKRSIGVKLNPQMPAYDELIALPLKLETRWPTTVQKGIDEKLEAIARADVNPTKAFRHFGTKLRNETLLTLFAMKKADFATLKRAISTSDVGEIAQAIRMFVHYGIVRSAGKEGNARLYELNPEWFAAPELHAMLKKLVQLEPRYAGRLAAVEPQMTARRKKMRENARKKQRKFNDKSGRG